MSPIESMRVRITRADPEKAPNRSVGDEVVVRKWQGDQWIDDGIAEAADAAAAETAETTGGRRRRGGARKTGGKTGGKTKAAATKKRARR